MDKKMKDDKQIMKEIKERLEDRQDEYFGLLTGLMKDGTPVKKKYETRFIYEWERMKVLQKEIINLTNHERERNLMIVKQQLEEAFTPTIRRMIEKKEISNGKL